MESNFHGEDDSNNVEYSSIPASASNSSKRLRKSSVWTIFSILDPEEQLVYQANKNDTKERAKCKYCRIVMIGRFVSGTSTMRHHMESCKKIELPIDERGGNKIIDSLVLREMLAESVITHGYPFKIVEDAKLRAFHSYLNSNFKLTCRNTCKADCLKVQKKMKEKVKFGLEKISSRISLTANLWTSCTTDGYFCLTAHFVDDDWKLHSLILNFRHVLPPHSAFLLYKEIYNLLEE
ncbi:hypothetical protein REPUB_Repub15cG0074700 [Reevesia pubescens]